MCTVVEVVKNRFKSQDVERKKKLDYLYVH